MKRTIFLISLLLLFILPSCSESPNEETPIAATSATGEHQQKGMEDTPVETPPARSDYLHKSSLCYTGEEEYFGITTARNGKLLSLCVSANPSYIVYRFGRQGKVELEYPSNMEDSWNSFAYSYYLRGGGADNEPLDINYLSFTIGKYTYEVYDEYSGESAENLIGIHVTDSNNETVAEIEGLDQIGSLVKLRGSKIKEVPYLP